jgi:hypothetical protein
MELRFLDVLAHSIMKAPLRRKKPPSTGVFKMYFMTGVERFECQLQPRTEVF